jgi:hypothetical protein
VSTMSSAEHGASSSIQTVDGDEPSRIEHEGH